LTENETVIAVTDGKCAVRCFSRLNERKIVQSLAVKSRG